MIKKLLEPAACTRTHVSSQTATDGWSLPVEPVICVAWKRKGVVAAEIVAGISVLKGSRGQKQHQQQKSKAGEERGETLLRRANSYLC